MHLLILCLVPLLFGGVSSAPPNPQVTGPGGFFNGGFNHDGTAGSDPGNQPHPPPEDPFSSQGNAGIGESPPEGYGKIPEQDDGLFDFTSLNAALDAIGQGTSPAQPPPADGLFGIQMPAGVSMTASPLYKTNHNEPWFSECLEGAEAYINNLPQYVDKRFIALTYIKNRTPPSSQAVVSQAQQQYPLGTGHAIRRAPARIIYFTFQTSESPMMVSFYHDVILWVDTSRVTTSQLRDTLKRLITAARDWYVSLQTRGALSENH
ncbi:hypothetical protein IWQ61_005114 [Dispira simplex]|nr:hypothetical protein IWQ61_005114 [Dispira simplex]